MEALAGHVLSDNDAATRWEMLAGESHASFLTLPLIEAAIAATVTPMAREAMWGELAALSDRIPRDESDPTHAASLIGLLERHRGTLHARIGAIAETVGGGDEMIRLMLGTRLFGATLEEGVSFMVRADPVTLHRRIERDRSAGKPVMWQITALTLLAPWYEAQRSAEAAGSTEPLLSKADMRHRFIHGAFVLHDATGGKLGSRFVGDAHLPTLLEPAVVGAFKGHHLTREDAAAVWEMLASEFHAPLVTLPLLQAIVSATDTPSAREALWSELSGLAMRLSADEHARVSSLLGHFERHAEDLKPLLGEIHESEGGGDEMVKLMLATRVFGADLRTSLGFVAEHSPAALARKIERDRSAGKPVTWERTAFDLLLHWKNDRLRPGAKKAPTTLAALDAAGEQLVAILNGLHDFDDRDRGRVIEGLGPAEVFNVIVAGERELYRLGTSSYRKFLHPVVAADLEKAGSLEAFLEQVTVERLGEEAIRATGRRAIVFLRVASSFGLIDPILERVLDRARFIDMAIASLGDAAHFEGNSSVLIDVQTVPSGSRALAEFKRTLLARLYERYGQDTDASLRSVYGSMLSVYQTVTADRRVTMIDRDFPLDNSIFEVPFDRLFTASGHGRYTHRIFMRMDQDTDAKASYNGFRVLMRSKATIHRDRGTFEVFTLHFARAIGIMADWTKSNAGTANADQSACSGCYARGADLMVYSLDIRPEWGYYTGVELLDGDRLKIGPLNQVNDGSVGWYGTPADPAHFPKHVKWMDRKGNPVPDFDAAQLISVSERAKSIIEQLEPGVHQFLPVEFVDIHGRFLENRYWFIVCSRLDSVDRANTTMVLYKGTQWVNARDLVRRGEPIPPHIDPSVQPRLVFNLEAVGGHQIWVDKHTGHASGYISERMAVAFKDAGLTGIRPFRQEAI